MSEEARRLRPVGPDDKPAPKKPTGKRRVFAKPDRQKRAIAYDATFAPEPTDHDWRTNLRAALFEDERVKALPPTVRFFLGLAVHEWAATEKGVVYVFTSMKKQARALGLHRLTVLRYWQELESLGVVQVRERRRSDGGKTSGQIFISPAIVVRATQIRREWKRKGRGS